MAWQWTAWQWTVQGLGNERLDVEAMGMDVMTATRRQWNTTATARNGLSMAGVTATAMDGLAMDRSAMDGLAMDGASAWLWTAQRQRGGNGRIVGDATAAGRCDGNGRLNCDGLGWEFRSEFREIPRLIRFRTF